MNLPTLISQEHYTDIRTPSAKFHAKVIVHNPSSPPHSLPPTRASSERVITQSTHTRKCADTLPGTNHRTSQEAKKIKTVLVVPSRVRKCEFYQLNEHTSADQDLKARQLLQEGFLSAVCEHTSKMNTLPAYC